MKTQRQRRKSVRIGYPVFAESHGRGEIVSLLGDGRMALKLPSGKVVTVEAVRKLLPQELVS